ncbi:MAG: amidohydrolase family protein [Nitrososphaerota archaeon]|nr:amidohydrolase family protein [Nitrososphaerota archaeon]
MQNHIFESERFSSLEMIIDCHVHAFIGKQANLLELRKRLNGSRREAVVLRVKDPAYHKAVWGDPQDATEILLNDMDAHGIDKSLIQPSGFRYLNPLVINACKKHPDRFAGLMFTQEGFPVAEGKKVDFDDIAKEIKTCVDSGVIKGLGETNLDQFTTESAPEKMAKDIFPLMDILAKYKLPVQFMSGWNQFGSYIWHGVPMYVDMLAHHYPEVPIVITKMGRGFTFLFEMALALASKHENVYLDATDTAPEHIARAVHDAGADRLMWGTDWCSTWRSTYSPCLYSKRMKDVEDSGISEEDKEWVMWKTAATVYKLAV